ncbi:MAG TPA: metal ABC transporter permease [Streptosporangiaceae bacterium]
MHQLSAAVFGPGFFASPQVHTAVTIGAVVAVVSAVTGVFTVMRGQSFAGHALGDVSAAGGSGALLIGLTPLPGFVGAGIVGAGVMDMIGVQRLRGRDLATGIVLGAAIGCSALFLYLGTTSGSATGATQQILFGSIFTTTPATVTAVATLGAIALASLAAIARPLLLATVSPDIAAARGAPVRLTGLLFMLALAVSVALSALAIGALLSTALLIGPAATALRLAKTVPGALATACLTGVAATWLGILLAYDSYYWGPGHKSLPVSFFIVAIIFATYLIAGLPAARAARRRAASPVTGAADRDRIAA